jgi:hypothetical protein
LTVAAIRDGLSITSKHAVPLLEYCDRAALTIRRQDVRVAGPELKRFGERQHPQKVGREN